MRRCLSFPLSSLHENRTKVPGRQFGSPNDFQSRARCPYGGVGRRWTKLERRTTGCCYVRAPMDREHATAGTNDLRRQTNQPIPLWEVENVEQQNSITTFPRQTEIL